MYGSTEETVKDVRDLTSCSGLLKVSNLRSRVNLKSLLPSADNDGFCRAMNKTTKPCFLAGDERVNENQGMQIH